MYYYSSIFRTSLSRYIQKAQLFNMDPQKGWQTSSTVVLYFLELRKIAIWEPQKKEMQPCDCSFTSFQFVFVEQLKATADNYFQFPCYLVMDGTNFSLSLYFTKICQRWCKQRMTITIKCHICFAIHHHLDKLVSQDCLIWCDGPIKDGTPLKSHPLKHLKAEVL